MQSKNYSDFLTRTAGQIGLPVSGMTADELNFLNSYFNTNMKDAWDRSAWTDLCPTGEARFAGNQFSYTNDTGKSAYWTATNLTISSNNIANPLDYRVTAARELETAVNGQHGVSQPVNFVPGAVYQMSRYVRPIGGRYLYMVANDTVNTYYAFFNLITGVVVSSSNVTSTTISQQANGFWLCQFSFTADSLAGIGTAGYQMSSDGSTLSYTGDITKGFYTWGNLLQQTTFASPPTFVIPFDQLGETVIGSVYDVFATNPVNASFPVNATYSLVQAGIQLIGAQGTNTPYYGYGFTNFPVPIINPVFVYYRPEANKYYGSTYSAVATYAVGEIVQYTNSANVINYYTCVVATTAGQNPTTTPASWSLNVIPEVLFLYACAKSYADWLRMDGQADKAQLQDGIAEEMLNSEFDSQEREQNNLPPMRVSTHVSSQVRF